MQSASSAFKRLAYKRFLNVPLYVEYAPEGIFQKPSEAPSRQFPAQSVSDIPAKENDTKLEFFEPGEAQGSCTLFIKGLSFGTTEASLTRRCSKAATAVGGVLRSVKLPTKKNADGQPLLQGYAFAEFNDHTVAKSVKTRLHGLELDGHKLSVELAQSQTKHADATSKKRGRADNSDTKLMVRNLAFEATSKDVRQLMESFGQVKSCRLPKKFDGSTRGFAFVEFATKGDALKAINSANGAHLYGRRLLLEYAKGDEGVEELRSKMAKGRLDVHYYGMQSGVDLDAVKMSMNPFCEIALEAALRFREAGHASEVVAATVGDQAILRHAYALGADRAIQVVTDANEPLMVAEALSSLTRREGAQCLFLGKQAIDGDHNQTGQMCAAMLGWSQGTFASSLSLQASHDRIHVTREIDEGQQELSISLPAVLTADLRLNTPRYASFKAVIASKKKPIEQVSAAELGLTCPPQLRTVLVEQPAPRQGGRLVSNVHELVDFLAEQKVL